MNGYPTALVVQTSIRRAAPCAAGGPRARLLIKPLRSATAGVLCLISILSLTSALQAETRPSSEPIRLSEMMSQVSRDPQFRENLLQRLDHIPKVGWLLGPNLVQRLRELILGKQWQALDRFPGLTVAQLSASVRVVNSASAGFGVGQYKLSPPYVELGPYASDHATEVQLDQPPANESTDHLPVQDLGYGVTMGDGPNPDVWPRHKQSLRLAYVLNRLALKENFHGPLTVRFAGASAHTPSELIQMLVAAHENLWVDDDRYFANFGHLHFQGRDVIMPFWINSRLRAPLTRQALNVPVGHSEHELHLRGPRIYADVSFYFGIDGLAEFRTMDTLDQTWVGKRVAHTYRGDSAREVIRLLGLVTRKYNALHAAHPDLPFGGYYALGVCQDANAMVEWRMQGSTTLFPITCQRTYFSGHDEVDTLFRQLPDDRNGAKPDLHRVLSAIPSLAAAGPFFPGFKKEAERAEIADRLGLLRVDNRWNVLLLSLAVAAAILFTWMATITWRKRLR